MRPTGAEIDLSAIAHNVAALRALVAPAAVCAVVKADGYGHGAVEISRAALAAGAERLAVALVEEGVELRTAGIEAPIIMLSEPPPSAMAVLVEQRLEPTVYTAAGIEALARAVRDVGSDRGTAVAALPVHLKVDTGMHRVGAHPDEALVLAKAIEACPELHLASVWTHCAVADQPDDPFTAEQLRRYDEVLAGLAAAGVEVPCRHAANTAVAMTQPAGRYDLVRSGIAIYGLEPGPALAGVLPLRPALRLTSKVSYVKVVEAGEALSYGQRYRLGRASVIATVPIGYADGVGRSLGSAGGEVLIGGIRRPIAGTVTMDQILVDCGDDRTVTAGDDVVLLGEQGSEAIGAWEWAERTGTISYEIVCGLSRRVPRHYVGGAGNPQEDHR